MNKKSGFVLVETIVVICVLTVALLSLYANYSKVITNTKELNTFDTAEYNYKTYFLKQLYVTELVDNECRLACSYFSDYPENSDPCPQVKMCKLKNVSNENYLKNNYAKFDAYIIDYLNNQDFTEENDDIFLVEYKKEDIINSTSAEDLYITYISSLNY